MSDYEFDDDEPFVVIERESAGIGSFLLGAAIGAGIALLMAPQSGEETRQRLTRGVRRVKWAAQDAVEDATAKVSDTFNEARRQVEERIDAARLAIELKKDQVQRAMEAGREAARDARGELQERIAATKAETRAAYEAGAGIARDARTGAERSAARAAVRATKARERAGALDDDVDGV